MRSSTSSFAISLAATAVPFVAVPVRVRQRVFMPLWAARFARLNMRPMIDRIERVLRPRSPHEVIDRVVCGVPVAMTNLQTVRARSDKRFRDKLMHKRSSTHTQLAIPETYLKMTCAWQRCGDLDSRLHPHGSTLRALHHTFDGSHATPVADVVHAFPSGNRFPVFHTGDNTSLNR